MISIPSFTFFPCTVYSLSHSCCVDSFIHVMMMKYMYRETVKRTSTPSRVIFFQVTGPAHVFLGKILGGRNSCTASHNGMVARQSVGSSSRRVAVVVVSNGSNSAAAVADRLQLL
jgi:hypothetical protein